MKRKSLISAGVLVMVTSFFLAVMPVYAEKDSDSCQPRKNWGSQKQEKFDNMIEKLNLSQEQVAQLKSHKQSRRQSHEKLHSVLKKQKEQLKVELEKPESDNARIKEIASSIKQTQSEMVDERIKGILEIKAILTQEQFKEFQAIMGRHMKRKMQNAYGEKKPLSKNKSKQR
ncbi:periplasmic heavy metal sensor [bacterium]|nr:MAG: periplasmic heavy metal sensor [bacterium]